MWTKLKGGRWENETKRNETKGKETVKQMNNYRIKKVK